MCYSIEESSFAYDKLIVFSTDAKRLVLTKSQMATRAGRCSGQQKRASLITFSRSYMVRSFAFTKGHDKSFRRRRQSPFRYHGTSTNRFQGIGNHLFQVSQFYL